MYQKLIGLTKITIVNTDNFIHGIDHIVRVRDLANYIASFIGGLKMGTVVAIGGFSEKIEDIRNICERIVKLSKKKKPNLLYIPTANGDHVDYTKYMTIFLEIIMIVRYLY